MSDDLYLKIGAVLGAISGFLTFVGSWWYCTAHYGFLFGFGLGWLPSGIAAVIVGLLVMFLWGLIAIAIGLVIAYAILVAVRGG
jgi:hypothetical protein